MNDITIIIPVHRLNEDEYEMLRKATDSVVANQGNYGGKLPLLLVVSEEAKAVVSSIMSAKYPSGLDYRIVVNDGATDFCSQINFAIDYVDTDFFSILEFDDEYTENWFTMADRYFYTNEDVSIFLPINDCRDADSGLYQLCNELGWASGLVKELGFLDLETLQSTSAFNLTGGIFNKKDFVTVGMFKPSIRAAFNYELMLRMVSKKLKVYVVPKEGYTHVLNRKGSLTEEYMNTLTEEQVNKWFSLAKAECEYTEDRNRDIADMASDQPK